MNIVGTEMLGRETQGRWNMTTLAVLNRVGSNGMVDAGRSSVACPPDMNDPTGEIAPAWADFGVGTCVAVLEDEDDDDFDDDDEDAFGDDEEYSGDQEAEDDEDFLDDEEEGVDDEEGGDDDDSDDDDF
jgi:hypothetical protein